MVVVLVPVEVLVKVIHPLLNVPHIKLALHCALSCFAEHRSIKISAALRTRLFGNSRFFFMFRFLYITLTDKMGERLVLNSVFWIFNITDFQLLNKKTVPGWDGVYL